MQGLPVPSREDTPDVLAELERDIEEGNVMMLSSWQMVRGKVETVPSE